MAETMVCPECDEEVPSEYNYCRHCGTDLNGATGTGEGDRPLCPECDAEVDPSRNFCRLCGAGLSDSSVSVDEDDGTGEVDTESRFEALRSAVERTRSSTSETDAETEQSEEGAQDDDDEMSSQPFEPSDDQS